MKYITSNFYWSHKIVYKPICNWNSRYCDTAPAPQNCKDIIKCPFDICAFRSVSCHKHIHLNFMIQEKLEHLTFTAIQKHLPILCRLKSCFSCGVEKRAISAVLLKAVAGTALSLATESSAGDGWTSYSSAQYVCWRLCFIGNIVARLSSNSEYKYSM